MSASSRYNPRVGGFRGLITSSEQARHRHRPGRAAPRRAIRFSVNSNRKRSKNHRGAFSEYAYLASWLHRDRLLGGFERIFLLKETDIFPRKIECIYLYFLLLFPINCYLDVHKLCTLFIYIIIYILFYTSKRCYTSVVINKKWIIIYKNKLIDSFQKL